MSGPPKRSHEEVPHPVSSKRPHEDIILLPSLSGKVVPQASNDYHPSFDSFPDGRMAKIPKTDPRDVVDRTKHDSRLYRIPSPANGSYLDHATDSKDGRDVKPEIRESKTETGELAIVARVESQGIKPNRPESRPEDKDSRFERDSRGDNKGEMRLEKDSGSMVITSLSHVRDSRDQQRPKRFPEPSIDMADPWRVGQHPSLHTDESGKEARTADALESWDAHDTIGDHKMELKSEEKLKEKERKRKEEKYRDWGDRDKDRNERYNLYPSSSSKESARQDRDADRWDRERKETQKSKESKDKDKDSLKKMPFNLHDKESIRVEKDVLYSSSKPGEQELATLEPKRTKEFDTNDRDGKDKRKEGSHDIETDRQDKRGRYHEKELDDGFGEGEVNAEREREVNSASLQQRRMARRQRGSSQAMHREARNRSRSREHDGSQEKPEVSYITYKIGESMQEVFLKAWKEFEANHENKKDDSLQSGGPMLEIRIPAEYVVATNRQVRGGQLWGTDIYTDDSDLVAVLMHTGHCRPSPVPLPIAIHELRASIQVLPPQDCYASTLRNNVRSRAWGDGIKCSFRVVKCCFVKWQKGGGTCDLEPRLNHISAVEPTLAPVSVERTMTTRAAASNALRQQRFVREVTVQYNLCNEPWLKYSINVVADKGLKKPLYTSARLKKGEVLYMETHSHRYEICFNGEKVLSNGIPGSGLSATESGHRSQHQGSHIHSGDRNNEYNNIVDVFRWSRCKRPLPQERMRSIGIPLPVEHLEVLEENLEWEDIQWSQTGVWVAGKEYVLARVHFLAAS